VDYSTPDFARDLRAAVAQAGAEADVLERVQPLLARFAQSRSWLKPEHSACDPDQGFGVHVLHEEPDHGLWVVAVSWLPRRGPPPHDHGTWAVIAGIEGKEENVIWRRAAGRLVPTDTRIVGPGQLIAFPQGAIHSVVNRGERTSLSLHVYGRNQNHAQRSRFDAETGAETAFKLKIQ